MKDDPVATCPECGGAVKRLLYPVGIVFKGTGWYINDSRKPEKTDAAAPAESKDGETKTADAKAEKSAEPATESKPQSKPDAAPAAASTK